MAITSWSVVWSEDHGRYVMQAGQGSMTYREANKLRNAKNKELYPSGIPEKTPLEYTYQLRVTARQKEILDAMGPVKTRMLIDSQDK